jgi:hypothetical protein
MHGELATAMIDRFCIGFTVPAEHIILVVAGHHSSALALLFIDFAGPHRRRLLIVVLTLSSRESLHRRCHHT